MLHMSNFTSLYAFWRTKIAYSSKYDHWVKFYDDMMEWWKVILKSKS